LRLVGVSSKASSLLSPGGLCLKCAYSLTMKHSFFLLLPLFVVTSCVRPPSVDSQTPPARAEEPDEDDVHGAKEGVDDPELAQLFLDSWESTMQWFPTWATSLGDGRYDDRLGSSAPEAREQRKGTLRQFAERGEALLAKDLGEQDRISLTLFLGQLERQLAKEVCRFDEWSVSPRYNVVNMAEGLAEDHPMEQPRDGANLLARYRELPRVFAEVTVNLERGLAEGWVANAESTRRTVELTRELLRRPDAEWRMSEPAKERPEAWDDRAFQDFAAELKRLVATEVRPAIDGYASFLETRVLPQARPDEAAGLSGLPGGASCYEVLVKQFTTLDVSADQLHSTGLAELEKIHEEFRTLGQRLWGTSDLPAIFHRLRTDPELYFSSEEEVEAAANEALERARARMGEAFGRVPKAECVVERIPELLAPYTTIAYYSRPAPDGSRPGRYYVNVHAPETRPRHEAEVLAFHEAIPGHHLQIAIAQELGDLPAFRRNMGATAFVEGWALYSERIADRMGLYTSDLDRMGMLSFDAWRAARLVVDTGIHAQGRSREWAVQFLQDNTPLALNNIGNEVDRYITTPGQALAYKTGQLEILALRREAEAVLGEGFSEASFHDAVLGAGAVTLPVLRTRIEDWLKEQGGKQ